VRSHLARLLAAALALHSLPAAAGDVVLDLEGALARASQSPSLIAARGRVAEAEAGRQVPLTNPEVEVEAGPRYAADTTTDVSVQLGQTFELGRRGARVRVADAEVAQARAAVDATAREVRREVALAFYRALHAERVVELARHGEELAVRGADVAERRRRAGDITELDAGLGRAALGRARAAVRAAEAERAAAVGQLAQLLTLAPGDRVVLRGELGTAAPATGERADLRALAAEAAVARAELDLARTGARPDVGLWLGYSREEDADIVVGGLRLTLPILDRGQGAAAKARARAARAGAERAAAAQVVTRQVRDTADARDHARAAVAVFESDVLPLLDESERLLTRTVDAGQMAIGDYLVARRELLDGRAEHVYRLLELATAKVELDAAAGVLR
jgi:cobalt-zinc-cadmium efflux system outer membrane protein